MVFTLTKQTHAPTEPELLLTTLNLLNFLDLVGPPLFIGHGLLGWAYDMVLLPVLGSKAYNSVYYLVHGCVASHKRLGLDDLVSDSANLARLTCISQTGPNQ